MRRPVLVWVDDPEVRTDGNVDFVRMTYRLRDGRRAHQYVPIPPDDRLTPDGVDTQAHVEQLTCSELKVELEKYIANRSYLRGLLRHREKERDEARRLYELVSRLQTPDPDGLTAEALRTNLAKVRAERDALEEALNEIDALGDLQFGPACRIARDALAALPSSRGEGTPLAEGDGK